MSVGVRIRDSSLLRSKARIASMRLRTISGGEKVASSCASSCRSPSLLREIQKPGYTTRAPASSHGAEGIGAPVVIALADTAVIMPPHLEALGEGGNLIAPIGAVAVEPADEEDGETSAVPLVVDVAVADRNARHRPKVRLRGSPAG